MINCLIMLKITKNYQNIVFNLLQQNYLHLLEHDKNIFDILCLNKKIIEKKST